MQKIYSEELIQSVVFTGKDLSELKRIAIDGAAYQLSHELVAEHGEKILKGTLEGELASRVREEVIRDLTERAEVAVRMALAEAFDRHY